MIHRLRLDVFETAARNAIDVVFTNNSIWAVADGRTRFSAFALEARKRVEAAGGRVVYVQLAAPEGVLLARVNAKSRSDHGKLTDPARLRELLSTLDPEPLHPDDLVIDTSTTSPAEAAQIIAGTCA